MNNQEAQEHFRLYLNRRYGDRSTPQHYLSDLKIFLEAVSPKEIDEITATDVDRFVDAQRAQGLSGATVHRRLAALRTFFEMVASLEPDQEHANPVNWRRHGPKQGQRVPRDASDAEVSALFDRIDTPRDRAMYGLMVGAGLRVGEVAALQRQDVQPPVPPSTLARLFVCGKGGKERVVWLTPRWYGYLTAYLAVRPASDTEQLFLNQRGQGISVNGIQHRFQQLCEPAGLTLTCHQLRHTFARRLAEQAMPIESIAQLLGHTQVTTTQHYTAGADPQLQAQFAQAMLLLERRQDEQPNPPPLAPRPPRQHYPAPMAELERALARYADFPAWLRSVLDAHLRRCWHDWKPHMAASHAHLLSRRLAATWCWLLERFTLSGWQTLRRSHIEQWLDVRLQRGLAVATVSRELDSLFAVLHFAQARELPLHANLFRVSRPQRSHALPRHLEEDAYQRLLQTVLDQTATGADGLLHRTWFLTVAFTGIRLSELLDLRLGDVDLSGRRLLIPEAKNRQGRYVFLTPALAQHLHLYLATRPHGQTDHLFLDSSQRPLGESTVRTHCRRWSSAAGVPFTPHRLRHTFATRLINQDVPLESIRRLLGHKTLYMTQQYARLHDTTVLRHCQQAITHLEGIPVADWPLPSAPIRHEHIQHLVNSM